jgi:hypothetical protein
MRHPLQPGDLAGEEFEEGDVVADRPHWPRGWWGRWWRPRRALRGSRSMQHPPPSVPREPPTPRGMARDLQPQQPGVDVEIEVEHPRAINSSTRRRTVDSCRWVRAASSRCVARPSSSRARTSGQSSSESFAV